MALFENDPNLIDKNRSNTIKYIEDFYKVIDDPNRYKREITDKCRGSAPS